MIGVRMATAIALDALVIRTMLVPAIMHAFVRANWYLPAWLDRHLPRLEIESGPEPAPRPDSRGAQPSSRPHIPSVSR
jgi:RND superfamily putative drug exporter